MASVILNGDTSGSVTISPPAVAGTQTVTLPAASGVLQVSGNMPAFSVWMNNGGSTLSSSSGVATKAKLDTKEFDTNSFFDATTNYRFTPTIAGYYLISAACNVTWGSGSGIFDTYTFIYKNGSSYKMNRTYASNVGPISNCITALVYLNGSTDYIELYGEIVTSATSPSIVNGQTTTWMTGVLVRTA